MIGPTTCPCIADEGLLWKYFKEGHENALSQIYLSYYSTLYNYAYKICGNTELAEDCIQDMFTALWTRRKQLGNAHSIKAYLIACLRRRVIASIIQRDKMRSDSVQIAENQPDIVFSPEDFLIIQETSEMQKNQLVKSLNKLTRRQREVIYLRYYDELSYKEISEILNINYQSVINILHRSYQVLKKSHALKQIANISPLSN